MINKTSYTRKELTHKTGAKFYIIDYLRNIGKLPVVARSLKRGIPTLYHPDSIKIVQEHIDNRYKSVWFRLNTSIYNYSPSSRFWLKGMDIYFN